MKATFALLANSDVHNYIRKLSWDIHQKYRTGTRHAALPPHISLKQPFHVPDLRTLDEYMDELAGSLQPFDVTLTELQAVPMLFDGTEYGILWAAVEETETLRELHHRINKDLSQRFGDVSADFDGDKYRFHMSVMMCGHLMEICNKYQGEIEYSKINLSYTAHELAMFVYDEPTGPHGDQLCYKIRPLGR
ncbi:MAG: 2'-5' RNA ligase family protein [Anaerolineales bacterium]|nr:2'-5' RNA ligase family protein [Anaerolineales bacterium]